MEEGDFDTPYSYAVWWSSSFFFLSVLTLIFMRHYTVSLSCLFLFHNISKENNVCFLCFIKNELILNLFQDAACFIHSRGTVPESVEDPLVFPGSS